MRYNEDRKLVNCLGCGRDTRSQDGYCWHCTHGVQTASEKKDRSPFHIDGDPLSQLFQEPLEDDYSEDAIDSIYKPFDGEPYYLSHKEEDRHFKKMKARIP